MLLSSLRLGPGARSPLSSERSVRSGHDKSALVRTKKRQSTANNRFFYVFIALRWVYMGCDMLLYGVVALYMLFLCSFFHKVEERGVFYDFIVPHPRRL